MNGFRRDGSEIVAVLEDGEAEVFALVVGQVAGLIEDSRTRSGDDPELGSNPGAELDELLYEPGSEGPPNRIEIDRTRVDSGLDLGFGQGFGLADPPSGDPGDPVLSRLFPDGYRDDPEASAELRAMISGDLHTQKLDNANTLLATLPAGGGEVRLDGAQAESWLLALNDARLALGTRLDVTDDMDLLEELDEAVLADPQGPRVLALTVYYLLGHAQETLVEALTG
ncbi:MAG: hypothetical protein QOJ50_2254 [Cryptosporangiaceae bacterium]|jgi:hypothetical protein|nr:hypothetical protein [Cryptosporangiaceae bacterium]